MMKTEAKPKKSLGPEPAVTSAEDLQLALQWRGWIGRRLAQLTAAMETAIAELKQSFQRDRLLKVGKASLDLAAYDKLLDQAIADHARDHYADFFTEKSKTWKCPAGSISAKLQPQRVVFIDPEQDEEAVINGILDQADLVPELDRLRAEFAEAFPYLKIVISLDRQGILTAYRGKALTDLDLSAKGLKIDREPELISSKI